MAHFVQTERCERHVQITGIKVRIRQINGDGSITYTVGTGWYININSSLNWDSTDRYWNYSFNINVLSLEMSNTTYNYSMFHMLPAVNQRHCITCGWCGLFVALKWIIIWVDGMWDGYGIMQLNHVPLYFHNICQNSKDYTYFKRDSYWLTLRQLLKISMVNPFPSGGLTSNAL